MIIPITMDAKLLLTPRYAFELRMSCRARTHDETQVVISVDILAVEMEVPLSRRHRSWFLS